MDASAAFVEVFAGLALRPLVVGPGSVRVVGIAATPPHASGAARTWPVARVGLLGALAPAGLSVCAVARRRPLARQRRVSGARRLGPRRNAVPSAVAPLLAPVLAPQLEDELIALLDKGAPEEEVLRLAGELEALGGQADSPEAVRGNWELRLTSSSKFDLTAPLGRRVDGSTPGLEAVVPTLLRASGADDTEEEAAASSSPIQRFVTQTFRSTQDITEDRVDTYVSFGGVGSLRLSAEAATDADTPRRLNFTFDLAYFEIFGVRIPYPVPFKLLGDEAKGWIETTYVSSRLRISRGNKGTVFVLSKAAAQTSAAVSEDAQASNRSSVVVLPGLGNDAADYETLVASLQARGFRASVVPVARLDWLRNALGLLDVKWWLGVLEPRPVLDWYLERVASTVDAAAAGAGEGRVVLLGHSAGGWLARVYLCGYCGSDEAARACVKKLVTIGTPHLPPEEGSDGSFDQTRGILTYVQRNYLQLPAGIDGASVGSKFLKGEADAGDLGAFVTGIGYQQVCGKAQVWGDGIVPVPSMRVPGWQWREVSGVWHSPLGALDRKWYGDDGVISEWVDLLE